MALNFSSRGKTFLWLALFFLSGAAGLGYQTVWTKLFANGLGHEVPAMLSVVCAFMTGMALGAWIGARRRYHEKPAAYYATLEALIGFWGLASCWVIPWMSEGMLRWFGPSPGTALHWTLTFASTLIAVLPGTAAMGATFAVMEQLLAMQSAEGRAIGALYASNTAGAVLGILGGTFVLMPQLGLRSTLVALAAVNFLCAVLALKTGRAPAGRSVPAELQQSKPLPTLSPQRLQATIFATGFLAIGLEVVGIRVLSQVLENTIFTFAVVLAIYLLGTALGAAAYQRIRRRVSVWWLLWAASVSGAASILVLSDVRSIHGSLRQSFSDSFAAAATVELLCAAAVFFLPTVILGGLFSHLFQMAKHSAMNLGKTYALNCLGSALAPLIIGVWLLPTLGAKAALSATALGYLAFLPFERGLRWAFLAVPVGLLLLGPSQLRIMNIPAGGSVLEFREGLMASVAVVQDAAGNRTLHINNRFQMGGTAAHQAEYRQAHIPLLLHPQPRRALFLGVGTGITMAAAQLYSGLEVEGVELVQEVSEMKHYFAPYNQLSKDPARVLVADARRYVRATPESYDVIVADLFHPARDGAGTLYTEEHFRAVRRRLAEDGLFCQWLPLHQMDHDTLQLIVRTFLTVFPNAQAYLLHFNVEVPVLGLMGFTGSFQPAETWLETKRLTPALQAELKKLALADSLRFFGHFVGGPEFLRSYGAAGAINTDDRQRVTFQAPAFSFRKNVSPHGRLWGLLQPAKIAAAELGFGNATPRLAKYIEARDTYLLGLVEEAQGLEDGAIRHFIESARISEDFTAGYAQCLSKASLWIREQPEKARELLRQLAQAQPSRTVAQEMLNRMNNEGK